MADVGWSSAKAIERSAQTTFDGPPGVAAPGGHFHVPPPQGGRPHPSETFRRINPTNLVGQGQNRKNFAAGKENRRSNVARNFYTPPVSQYLDTSRVLPRPRSRALHQTRANAHLMIATDFGDAPGASIETLKRALFSGRERSNEKLLHESAAPREVGHMVVLVKPSKTFWSSIHSTPMFADAQFPRGPAALESAALLLNRTSDPEPASALQARRYPRHSKNHTQNASAPSRDVDGDGEETAHSAHDQGRRCGVTSISNRGVGRSHTEHDPSRIPDLRLMSSLAAGWRPSHELRERHRRGPDAPTRGTEVVRESGLVSTFTVRHEILAGSRSRSAIGLRVLVQFVDSGRAGDLSRPVRRVWAQRGKSVTCAHQWQGGRRISQDVATVLAVSATCWRFIPGRT
jgi:hypothetical protein